MIRRRGPAPRRSEWTVSSGRMWSPDSWLNQPLGEVETDPEALAIAGVTYSCSIVVDVSSVGVFGLPDCVVNVAKADRTIQVDAQSVSLDAVDPPPSIATGLVLARELGDALVEHALAVVGPWPVGTRLAGSVTDVPDPIAVRGALAIATAGVVYGAVCVRDDWNPDAWAVVLVEQPPGGAGWPASSGVYREVGIRAVEGDLPLLLAPIVTRRRRYSIVRGWRDTRRTRASATKGRP